MKDFQYRSRDGLNLYARLQAPDGDVKGVIGLIHGLGEYGGRYCDVGRVFADRGYAFVAGDLRGHGLSQGRRAFAPRLDSFLDDFDRYIAAIRERFPGKPLFLYAFSMGSPLTAVYLAERQPHIAGAVLVSGVYMTPLPAKVRALSLIAPTMAVSNTLGPLREKVCHDVAVLDAYDADSLVYKKITIGLAVIIAEAGRTALAHAGEIRTPVLIMHGDADVVAAPEGSKQLAAAVTGDATLKLWPGLYHFLNFEPGAREHIFPFVTDWCDAHLPK